MQIHAAVIGIFVVLSLWRCYGLKEATITVNNHLDTTVYHTRHQITEGHLVAACQPVIMSSYSSSCKFAENKAKTNKLMVMTKFRFYNGTNREAVNVPQAILAFEVGNDTHGNWLGLNTESKGKEYTTGTWKHLSDSTKWEGRNHEEKKCFAYTKDAHSVAVLMNDVMITATMSDHFRAEILVDFYNVSSTTFNDVNKLLHT